MGRDFLVARILGIVNFQDFYYYACHGCQKKVDQRPRGFTCYRCNSTNVATTCKYKLIFVIARDSESILITVFDKLLGKYFGCKAFDLVRLVDHINRTDGDNCRSKTILNSAMSEVFVGQIFCFEFNSHRAFPLNSSGKEILNSTKSSLTVKQMCSMNNSTNSATVLYCIFSELQGVQLQSSNEDFLNKIKCEAQILKKRADVIKKTFQHHNAHLFETEECEDTHHNQDNSDGADCQSVPRAITRSEHMTSSCLMNETFVQDFFRDSFSFIYRDEAVCENQPKLKQPVLTNDNIVSTTPQTPQMNCSISEIWSTNDSIFLQIPTTPKMSNIQPNNNNTINGVASEDVKDPFDDSINMDITWSHIFKKQKHSYLTSTPACDHQPRVKRRRLSEVRQLSALSSQCEDKSASDIFASESMTNQDDVQSMDLFESMN